MNPAETLPGPDLSIVGRSPEHGSPVRILVDQPDLVGSQHLEDIAVVGGEEELGMVAVRARIREETDEGHAQVGMEAGVQFVDDNQATAQHLGKQVSKASEKDLRPSALVFRG